MALLKFRKHSGTLLLPLAFALAGCGDDEKVGGNAGTGGAAGTAGSGGAAGSAGGDGGAVLPPPFDDTRVPVTDEVTLDAVTNTVDVVRDRFGHVHIFARTMEDLFYVQGYMMAYDRAGVLELARRVATGRLAEIFGGLDPTLRDDDITTRTLGFHRVAKEAYDAIPAGTEQKRALDSFAAGISKYNEGLRDGSIPVHEEFLGLNPDRFVPWEAWMPIAMGRVQSENLSYDGDSEIGISEDWNEALSVFTSTSSDPLVQKRAGFARDVMRMDPIDPTTPLDGFPDVPSGARLGGPPQKSKDVTTAPRPVITRDAYRHADRFVESIRRIKRMFGVDEDSGSNNWAVAGTHTTTGNAMVASDPHLGFTSPMVFWPCHLVVENPDDPSEDLDLAGLAFPGIPGIILGTNGRIAWGATTTGYDVTDVWQETISADGQGVSFKGQDVPFERFTESIGDGTGMTYEWDVLNVPHHGPMVPSIGADHKVTPPAAGSKALSTRWTGHEPTNELLAITNLYRAQNLDEAMTALVDFGVGNQNWMIADDSGDVGFTSHVKIPFRDARTMTFDETDYSGIHPGLVLDGASGNHEWTGTFLDEKNIPKVKRPASGYTATANGDNVGTTLDNNPVNDTLPDGTPFYIGFEFDEGWRIGRIMELLAEGTTGGEKIDLDDMARIQGDVKSAFGKRLATHLVAVLERAQAELSTAGSNPDLAKVVADPRYATADVADVIDRLKRWGSESDYFAEAGVNLDDDTKATDPKEANASIATFIFSAWLTRAIGRTFSDEFAKMTSSPGSGFVARAFMRLMEKPPSELATHDAVTGESALWDDMVTTDVESKDEILGLALLDAIDDGTTIFGATRDDWRWGHAHRVRFSSLNPIWPFNQPPDDDPVFPNGWPRHGDQDAVDACNYSFIREPSQPLSLTYGSGPVQRFVAELVPGGPPIVRTALPGGAVANTASKHFSNEAALWRRNENHEVPITIDAIAENYESDDEHFRITPGG